MILERGSVTCGVDTPKTLRGTIEDNAPEVDHIIPLRVVDMLSPTLDVHGKCNLKKGDRIYQLI